MVIFEIKPNLKFRVNGTSEIFNLVLDWELPVTFLFNPLSAVSSAQC